MKTTQEKIKEHEQAIKKLKEKEQEKENKEILKLVNELHKNYKTISKIEMLKGFIQNSK